MNFRSCLLALLCFASLAGMTGCSYKRPVVLVQPSLETEDPAVLMAVEAPPMMALASEGVTVTAPYRQDELPALTVVLSDVWPQMGTEVVSGVHAVRLLGEGAETMTEWRPRSVSLPPSADSAPVTHRCVLAIPPQAVDGADREVALLLEIHRLNAPPQLVRFDAELTWVTEAQMGDAKTKPREVAAFRRDLLGYTYVLWGLPRDLVDAPFTWINRMGFGQSAYSEKGQLAPGITYGVLGLAGTFGGAYLGIKAGVPNVVKIMVLGGLGTVGGSIAGLLVGVVGDLAYGRIGQPIQTALLRSGAGSDRDMRRRSVTVEGGWDDAELDEFARIRRTWDYFPNWKHIAHRRTFEAPQEPERRLVPVVTGLRASGTPAP